MLPCKIMYTQCQDHHHLDRLIIVSLWLISNGPAIGREKDLRRLPPVLTLRARGLHWDTQATINPRQESRTSPPIERMSSLSTMTVDRHLNTDRLLEEGIATGMEQVIIGDIRATDRGTWVQ